MNTYMVEESENRRLLGAIFLSILIHVALLVLIRTTGWGIGFTDVGINRGGPISVHMGFERSTTTAPSTAQSNSPTEPEDATREGDRSARREVTVSHGLQKPTALPRPIPQPRAEVSPESSLQPIAESRPKPASERPVESVPEPRVEPVEAPEPEVRPVDTPKPQVEPIDTPEPQPEPPPAEATDPVDPVMEVQRQPSEEPPAAQDVLTSSSGITTVPMAEAESASQPDPVETPQTITEEPESQAVVTPDPLPEQVPDTGPSDDSHDEQTVTSSTTETSSEIQPQSDPGTEHGADGQASEQSGEPNGEPTGSPQPPPPPPAGGDMLGIGGRLVYPKAAETARGGPIEYSVSYEVLVSASGQVNDLTVVSQWFDRDLDERTKQDLLRTAELMVRGLITFGAYTSDYRMTVQLSFDAESGPALKPESRIRPIGDQN